MRRNLSWSMALTIRKLAITGGKNSKIEKDPLTIQRSF